MDNKDTSVTKSSQAESVSMQRRFSLRVRRYLIGSLVVVVTGVGATVLALRSLANRHAIPIVTTEEQQTANRKASYLIDTVNNSDVFTDDVRQLVAELEPRLMNVQAELSVTVNRLQATDPHLALALRDFRDTPLIGATTPRTRKDRLAKNFPVVKSLLNDFDRRHKTGVAANGLRENVDYMLTSALCSTAHDEAAYDALLKHYENGIREPLLLFALGAGSFDIAEQKKYFGEAMNVTDMNQTSPLLGALIYSRWPLLRKQLVDTKLASLQFKAIDNLFDAMAEAAEEPEIRNYVAFELVDVFVVSNAYARFDILERAVHLPDEKGPAWLPHYLVYFWSNQIANTHRGIQYINKVAPGDLDEFDNYSKLAAQHLLKAWCLKPDSMLFPAKLMELQYWSSCTPLQHHQWFRLAVSAECDHEHLFSEYSNSLLPKWGGSEAAVLRTANLTASTRAGDIAVPFYTTQFLSDLIETREQLPLTDDVRFLSTALHIVEFLKTKPSCANQCFGGGRAMILARILWEWGRLAELAWLFENYPNACAVELSKWNHFAYMPLYRDFSKASMRSGHPLLWQQLHRELLTKNQSLTTDHLDSIESIIEELREKGDDQQEGVFKLCERLCEWRRQFDRGEPVALSADGTMLGWAFINLPTTPVPGGFESTVWESNNTAIGTCLLQFPLPFRVEADFEMIGERQDRIGIAMFVGNLKSSEKPEPSKTGALMRFVPGRNLSITDQIPGNVFSSVAGTNRYYEQNSPGPTHFRMDVRPSGTDFFIGGERTESPIVGPIKSVGSVQFGRYTRRKLADGNSRTVTYQIKNITVTKLSD